MANDTSSEAQAAQLAVWKRLGPSRTAEMAMEWGNEILQQTKRRIQLAHPKLSEREVMKKLILEVHGIDVGNRS